MPITKLDTTAALIVIDLQKSVVSMPTMHPAGEIVARAAELARAFREASLPVVLVNVTGRAPGRTESSPPSLSSLPPDWSEFVPELEPQSGDYAISKQRWGAFIGTGLHDTFQQRGVTQVFITGVATSVGVESTARSAYDFGYNVALVVDAITDRNPETHRNSVEKIFPRLGEIDTTENVLQLLSERRQARA